MPDHDDLLDPFFAAIERGDIDAVAPMYADDVAVWHNVSGQALDKPQSLDLLRYWTEKVRDVRYEVLERQPFEGGIVQRHIVRGDASGTPIEANVCIVFHVPDGRITAIFEYLDAAAVSAAFGVRTP